GAAELLGIAGGRGPDVGAEAVVDPLRLAPLRDGVETVDGAQHRDQRHEREVEDELELETGHRQAAAKRADESSFSFVVGRSGRGPERYRRNEGRSQEQ